MRKETWFRGPLLSVLFLGCVTLLAAPLSAQGHGDAETVDRDKVPTRSDGNLFDLRRSVLEVAEDAYTRSDVKTLERMETAPFEQTMAEVAERLFRDLGEDMSRAAPSGLERVASAGSWWSCLMEYLGSAHSCWMAYNNCMQPRGGRAPNESWCKVMLDACLDAAAERYDVCRDGPPPV